MINLGRKMFKNVLICLFLFFSPGFWSIKSLVNDTKKITSLWLLESDSTDFGGESGIVCALIPKESNAQRYWEISWAISSVVEPFSSLT